MNGYDEYIQDQIGSQSLLFMIRKNEQGACLFLTDDNRCAIHRAKPKACRFYTCTENSSKDVLPWTATCTDPAQRAELWEQSGAAMMTKAYISVNTGGFKLRRSDHCIFFYPDKHCTIKEVRPMHCRFTPCPHKTESDEVMGCLFLGSGRVEEQFRHQVALAMTLPGRRIRRYLQ